jgi:6-phosphofructokinase 1
MKRLAVLTAGGDTPALNATIHGVVTRANERRVEVFGLLKGFSALHDRRVPHVHLNPLFAEIPEIDPTRGGTLIGASRAYLDPDDAETLDRAVNGLARLQVDGLICVGGDGTLNGLQALADRFPAILAPKTIDNDLGLNYRDEPNDWTRETDDSPLGYRYVKKPSRTRFDLEGLVNYVTPGFATSVFVAAEGVRRVRTTAESHRRIAIIEVMGRSAGFIALGSAYGQPDIVLVPEHRLDVPALTKRVEEIYELQKHVVIVCGEGIVDEHGAELGAKEKSFDPAGNVMLSGAAEALRKILMDHFGDRYFQERRRADTAAAAIFTRKVGHIQRGGRPIQFDRFHAAQLGGKSVDLLLEGRNNAVAVLQWSGGNGFGVEGFDGNGLRDRWGHIHARQMHPSLVDPAAMQPSRLGVDYLLPIFSNAVGYSDAEYLRYSAFDSGNLFRPYHSVNTDVAKRIRYLADKAQS